MARRVKPFYARLACESLRRDMLRSLSDTLGDGITMSFRRSDLEDLAAALRTAVEGLDSLQSKEAQAESQAP